MAHRRVLSRLIAGLVTGLILTSGVGTAAQAQTPTPKDPDPAMAARAKGILEGISSRALGPIVKEFDAKMLEAVPDSAKLGALWDQIVAQTGPLKSLGAAKLYETGPVRLIVFAATFERGEFAAGIAFDADGKIAGLAVRPQPWP